MKKLITVISVLMLTGASIFSNPNEACAKAIEEGKAFEAEGKWIHAASKYFEAMEADPSEAEFAADRYLAILTSFKNGEPGPGKYDDFSLYAGWVEITKEAEDYFNENMIGNICSYIVKGNPDYDTMTYSYNLYMSVIPTENFNTIMFCLKNGFDSKYNSNWKKIPRCWPGLSVYDADASDKRPLVVADIPEKIPKVVQFCGLSNVIFRSELEYSKKNVIPAWNFPSQRIDATKKFSDGIRCEGCYRVEYDIVDLNGNVITSCGPLNIMTVDNNSYLAFYESGKITVKGISAQDAQKIDQNQYKIVYKNVSLVSGLLKGKNLVTGKTDVKGSKSLLEKEGVSHEATEFLFGNFSDSDIVTVSFDLTFSKAFPVNLESVKSKICADGNYEADKSVYDQCRKAVENKKKL